MPLWKKKQSDHEDDGDDIERRRDNESEPPIIKKTAKEKRDWRAIYVNVYSADMHHLSTKARKIDCNLTFSRVEKSSRFTSYANVFKGEMIFKLHTKRSSR